MQSKTFKISRIIFEGLFILLFLFIMALSLPRLFGYQFVTIESGSMEPALHVGSACLIKNVKGNDTFYLKDGDIITYKAGKNAVIVTHRILSVNSDGSFVTKGDANEQADQSRVKPENVVGKVTLTIPGLGHILCFLSLRLGKVGMSVLLLLGIAVIWLFDMIWNLSVKKSEKSIAV